MTRRRPISAAGRPTAGTTTPLPLEPIPWGQPDPVLAEAICRQWLPAMMPATPWQYGGPSLWDHVRSWCGWCLVGTAALVALAFLGRP